MSIVNHETGEIVETKAKHTVTPAGVKPADGRTKRSAARRSP